MILGPVSLIDCAVFCLFLAPQLILHVGFFRTVFVTLKTLPFLLLVLPLQLVHERILLSRNRRKPFVARATLFEDLVVRCVRYAFVKIPAHIGRVFFSKAVVLPFIRWRMIRHGYLRCPVTWRTYEQSGPDGLRGIWISADPSKPADMVLYYVHGGGFALGSSYFYLEFLLAWHALLVDSGYKNPAIFALEYALVPDKTYPTQVHETLRGYKHVLSAVAGDSSRVVVGGDSAGGTLVLTMLLELGQMSEARACQSGVDEKAGSMTTQVNGKIKSGRSNDNNGRQRGWQAVSETPLPGLALLISPWTTLLSAKHKSTSDYLNGDQLHEYAMQYAGRAHARSSTASPGLCDDPRIWARASPGCGFFVTYGSEEIFAPDIRDFIGLAAKGIEVENRCEEGGIHAWPVASLFLSSTNEQRLRGLRVLTAAIKKHIV